MNRRDFITHSTTIMGMMPFIKLNSTPLIMNPDKHKFRIGDFECTIFKDLMFQYKAKDYFINAREEALNHSLEKYDINPAHIPSPFIAVLLKSGDRKILIDTGSGYSSEPITFRGKTFQFKGKLNLLLEEEGIRGEDITDVIITHLHPDHVGGVYSDDNVLQYPNARFYIQEEEWNFWHTSKSDQQIPLFKYFVQKNITPLSGQNLNLIKGDFQEIIPGITTVQLPGHTPGQIGLIINQGQGAEQLLYISDAFLHPLHMEQLDWQTNYDLDYDLAKQSRIKSLELAHQDNMLINAFHFDFPGLGRVDNHKDGWKWVYENT